MVLTEQKRKYMEKLSDENGIISALAFDQRGALKRLMAQYQEAEPTVAQMEELKVLVAEELTKMLVSYLHTKKPVMIHLAPNVYQTASTFGQQNASKNKVQMLLSFCSTMM